MKSNPMECLYCQNNDTLHSLMIEIAKLSVSRVFLFKEQTYEERNAFMADVARVTRAMQKVFSPAKINYGAYSDTLEHLHFHLVPKYVDGPDFGGVFRMNPKEVYLSDEEYASMIEKIKKEL